jgi:Na+/proline symporter
MTPSLVLTVLIAYFGLLLVISYFTSRNADANTFFKGNNQSPWYLVAFGMIGASLSGVTFLSIPGGVGNDSMYYMQIVLGYFVGYLVIAFVLLPLYYRLNLTSIYGYLQQRFGNYSYRTGAFYFLVSRIAGSSIRLLLVANILYEFVFRNWGVSFELTVVLSIFLIWVYTFRGGIKTVVWTDTLQTTFMILAVVLTAVYIVSELDMSWSTAIAEAKSAGYTKMFNFSDFKANDHFIKHVLGGMFVTICMTGLDQDMMQKNLTCKNIGEARKNMLTFSTVLIVVNLMFLFLGALLYVYAEQKGISYPVNEKGKYIADQVYALFALNKEVGIFIGITFTLGLIAAAYSSADGTLTALTTIIFVDFMRNESKPQHRQDKIRRMIHILVSLAVLLTVILFKYTLTDSAIGQVLSIAMLTYGPLLGMFAFGILTKYSVKDRFVPFICVLSPILAYLIQLYSEQLFFGYKIGYELLPINGLITFIGMRLLAVPTEQKLKNENSIAR